LKSESENALTPSVSTGVIPGRAPKRVYARLRRAMGANPESRRKFGVCIWIPGSLAFARAPE